MQRLAGFLATVHARMDAAIDAAGFPADQRELLRATVLQYRPIFERSPLDEPIAVLYLIAEAWGRPLDEQVERVGAFCSLYLLAADLLDDVQDEDLAGKPHAAAGAAVATNSAVALLFLSLNVLHEALELEASESRRRAFTRLVDRISLLAVSGQHRDLTRVAGACSRADVLDMHTAKTASVSLVVECGALLAGCDEPTLEAYHAAGAHLARLVQLRDDLRDVFGKSESPDLHGGKPTYPMACFLEVADDEQQLQMEQLLGDLPDSLDGVRQLLHDSGAVLQVAEAIEASRTVVHESVAGTGNRHAAHRTLLDVADAVAHSVYSAPSLACSEGFWNPDGAWHLAVREAAKTFTARLAFLEPPALPALRPWHAPQWMYVPERRAIFYPDIEGQAEDVLPFQAALLGITELPRVAVVMREQVHVVLSHEMFHFWRHASGRLTHDHWHEEWAANRLAVAYLQRFEPAQLARSVRLAESILARFPEALDARAEAVLLRCSGYTAATGYGMSLRETAFVGLEMVRRLASESLVLEEVAEALLKSRSEVLPAA